MPKYTYPIVFVLNKDTGRYNGFIPDLYIFCQGDKLEDVYADAETMMHGFFRLASQHDVEYNPPSTLEEVTDKWVGYKVSLLTANIAD